MVNIAGTVIAQKVIQLIESFRNVPITYPVNHVQPRACVTHANRRARSFPNNLVSAAP